MLDIYWQDKTTEPRDYCELITEVFDLIEQNPVAPAAPFTEMDFNLLGRWRPYDRMKALQVLRRGSDPRVEMRSPITDPTRKNLPDVSTLLHVGRVGVSMLEATLDIDDAYLTPEWVAAELLPYMRQIAQALPSFRRAYADANRNAGELRRALGLPELPASLGYSIQWYYLMTPEQYARDYTRETLLAAPAFSVREPQPDWIELISYEHPLSFTAPETQRRMSELTRYLDTHRRDRAQP